MTPTTPDLVLDAAIEGMGRMPGAASAKALYDSASKRLQAMKDFVQSELGAAASDFPVPS